MAKTKAGFIEPMLLLRSETLPTGLAGRLNWSWTAIGRWRLEPAGKVQLRSRNDKDFNGRYPEVVKALSVMPDETVIDGEHPLTLRHLCHLRHSLFMGLRDDKNPAKCGGNPSGLSDVSAKRAQMN